MKAKEFESLLKQVGLSQADFARETKTTTPAVSRWKKEESFPVWVDGWLKGKLCQQELERVRDAINVLREIEPR